MTDHDSHEPEAVARDAVVRGDADRRIADRRDPRRRTGGRAYAERRTSDRRIADRRGADPGIAEPSTIWSERDGAVAEPVSDPRELWRIEGSLAAVRSELNQLTAIDDARLHARVAAMQRSLRSELEAIVPAALADEVHGLFDWAGDDRASPDELRIGFAQLEGWVEGFLSALGFSGRPEQADEAAPGT